MLSLEASDKLDIKIDSSTVQGYVPLTFNDIRSFIRCVFPKGYSQTGNNISRWILDKHKNNQFDLWYNLEFKYQVYRTCATYL